jgi:hypothetical protein
MMQLPRYFIVGARPVKFIATADGGMDVVAFDWESGQFVRAMQYLARCSQGDIDIDEVDEAGFEAHVARETEAVRARGGG